MPEGLKSKVRSAGRKGIAAGLAQLPDAVFVALRTSYPTTSPTSLKHKAMRRLLETARHRGIPRASEAFTLVDNPDVSFVRADSFVTERLYWFGERYGYEAGGIYWWRHFCRTSHRILE